MSANPQYANKPGYNADGYPVISNTDIPPSNKFYTMWPQGGEFVTVTVNAGATTTVGLAIDLTLFDFEHASLTLIPIAGTGTVNVNGIFSRDGTTNPQTVNNLITGATLAGGPKEFKFTDALMHYSHYFAITVTETGGANSLTFKAVIMARGN